MGNFEAADMAQLLTGLEGDHGHGARSGQRRQDGHTDGWCSDVEECKSDQVRADALQHDCSGRNVCLCVPGSRV